VDPEALADFLVYRPQPRAPAFRILRTDRGFRVQGKPPSAEELTREGRKALGIGGGNGGGPQGPGEVMIHGRVRIPMELTRHVPVIEAKVNGKGPFRFQVDSGFGGMMEVTPDLAKSLALPVIGESIGGDPSGKNQKAVRILSAESVDIGDVHFGQVEAGEGGPHFEGIDGVIGLQLFHQLLVTFDYPNSRFEIDGGGLPPADVAKNLTYTTELKTFIPASESVSIYGGLNGATGLSGSNNGFADPIPRRTAVEGLDLYVKYKPPNQADGYFSLAWTTEVFMRQLPELGQNDGGFYSQLVLQLDRRWFVGVREEMLGTPSTENQSKVQRTSLMTTFVMSEFARLRLYGERETRPAAGTSIFGGPDNYGVLLQLEVAIGAHGAHPF